MLIYHPATDIYHCWMRFAALLCESRNQSVEFDRARIIDFYLCFPHELENCSLTRSCSAQIRKLIGQIPISYENQYSLRQAFYQMKVVQVHVAMDMVGKSLIQREAYREGILTACVEASAKSLFESVATNWETRNTEWYAVVVHSLLDIPLNGKDGLKKRSGLLEFRYDA